MIVKHARSSLASPTGHRVAIQNIYKFFMHTNMCSTHSQTFTHTHTTELSDTTAITMYWNTHACTAVTKHSVHTKASCVYHILHVATHTWVRCVDTECHNMAQLTYTCTVYFRECFLNTCTSIDSYIDKLVGLPEWSLKPYSASVQGSSAVSFGIGWLPWLFLFAQPCLQSSSSRQPNIHTISSPCVSPHSGCSMGMKLGIKI